MPISRPLLIVLVAAVLALVGFYATQGSRNSVDSAPVVEAPPPTAVAKVDKSQAAKPPQADDAPAKQVRPKVDKAQPKADDKTQAKSDKASKPKAVTGPVAVRRAIDDRKRVVLFFKAPRGADDRATARAVAAQRGRRGVVVVSEPIARLARYRDLIGGLGISQAPAVVIVGKDGAARLVEGYVDPATLAQEVADAR